MGYEALEDALKGYGDYTDLDDLRKTDEKIICTCFQVTENAIIDAIKTNGLKTVDEVTNYTKAGGACGKCKGAIQAILDKYAEKEKLSPTQRILKVNSIIETQISPELQKDGGDIHLVDIQDKKIYVKLHGACSSCKNATLTIKRFVEQTLRTALGEDDLEVVEV